MVMYICSKLQFLQLIMNLFNFFSFIPAYSFLRGDSNSFVIKMVVFFEVNEECACWREMGDQNPKSKVHRERNQTPNTSRATSRMFRGVVLVPVHLPKVAWHPRLTSQWSVVLPQ